MHNFSDSFKSIARWATSVALVAIVNFAAPPIVSAQYPAATSTTLHPKSYQQSSGQPAEKLSLLPARASLRFDPAMPKVGQLVTPILEGTWSDGCIPLSAKLTTSASGGPFKMLLSFKLPGPVELILCVAAITPYRLELPPIKFDTAGRYDIQLVSDRGFIYDPSTLIVSEAGKSFAANNISGAWYDAKTVGSGLMLAHTLVGSADRLFGTWYFYTPMGVPTWLVLQDATWETPVKAVGALYKTEGRIFMCDIMPDCLNYWQASPSTKVEKVGTFTLDFSSSENGTLVLTDSSGVKKPAVVLQRLLP